MKQRNLMLAVLALGVTFLTGVGTAAANPIWHGNYHGAGCYSNLPPEQQAQAQKLYGEYAQKVEPLERQLFAKRSELDALYYNGQADSGKAQTLFREIAEIEAKLYTVQMDARKNLESKGLSIVGMGPCYGVGQGMGQGYRYGGGRGHGGWYGGGRGHGGWYGGGRGHGGWYGGGRGHGGGHW